MGEVPGSQTPHGELGPTDSRLRLTTPLSSPEGIFHCRLRHHPPPPPTARGRALLPRVGAEEAAQGRHWCPTTVQIPGLSFLRTKRAWKLSSAPEAGTQQRQDEMSEENTTSPSPAGPELSGQWKSPATPHWSKLKHFCARPQPHLLVPTDTYEKNNSRLYMPKWTGWSWQEAP